MSGKTQAAFSEGSRDLAGGREADSISAALSLPQRPLSPSRAANSQPVRETCLSSPWCLAGLAHSESTGLVGLGRQGFGMRLDCPLGLPPSYVMQGQSLGGCSVSQLLDSAALHSFPHAQWGIETGRAGTCRQGQYLLSPGGSAVKALTRCLEVALCSALSTGNVSALLPAALQAASLGGDGRTGRERIRDSTCEEAAERGVQERWWRCGGGRHGNPVIILLMKMISPDPAEGSARQSESRCGSPQGHEARAPLEEGLEPVQSWDAAGLSPMQRGLCFTVQPPLNTRVQHRQPLTELQGDRAICQWPCQMLRPRSTEKGF